MRPDTLKVVVADDDEPTCNLLSNLLKSFQEVTLVGTVYTGRSMLEVVRETSPDVVLVDVQMPDLDGLSAVYRMKMEQPGVFIIFVTGHDKYAVEAFNLNAGDYLVKPVDRERLARALNKAKQFKGLQAIAQGKATLIKASPAGDAEKGASDQWKLFLKSGGDFVVIDPDSIFFVESVGKKSIVHTVSNHFEISEQLCVIEQKLDPRKFFRCHKSFLINIDRVEKVTPYNNRSYDIVFPNYPHKAAMSRKKFKVFCRRINDR